MKPNWTGRRQAERRTCSVKAQAQLYDGGTPIDCIVTDFSAAGARIEFPADCEPPSAFDLFMPSRGDTRPAVVRWKTPDAVGVEFLQSRGTPEDQRLTDLVLRVGKLEEELRSLRAEAALSRGGTAVAPPIAVALPAASPEVDQVDETLLARVVTLEARNDEMLRAMRQTLALLGELRDVTAPSAARSLARAS